MSGSKTRKLAIDAMLAAMYVVLSFLSAKMPNMKISFDALPVLVGAALFGPWDGLAIGLIGSFIEQMISYGFTVTTPLWILPAAVRGLMVGAYARHKNFDMTIMQTMVITDLSALTVTALNTLALYVDSRIFGYYSYAFVFGMVIPRILVGVAAGTAFAVILPPLLRVLRERVLK